MLRILLSIALLCLVITNSWSQCIPSYEAPIELETNGDMQIEIDPVSESCISDEGCKRLVYSTDSLMRSLDEAEVMDGKYVVVLDPSQMNPGQHKLYYRLYCSASQERGTIMIVVSEGVNNTSDPFQLIVVDMEAYHQKKPFRVKVSAKGYPQAMITCSGCRDIELSGNSEYRITPGYASEIELTINGVTSEGDIEEVAVRRLSF